MKKLVPRTAYNARDEEHVGITFVQPSVAQQHFKQESDVNYIVNRYLQTGQWENVSERPPVYADMSAFDGDMDLIRAYEAVERAEDGFMRLPSDLRKKLDNDPSKLVSWLSDESNRADAVKFGLFTAPPAQSEKIVAESTSATVTEVAEK